MLSVVSALLMTAVLLAPAATTDPPGRLVDYVTDHAGVLSASDRGAMSAAIDSLYTDHHIRLWVVYVTSFSGESAVGWGRSTARLSDLGGHDALLAVATDDRSYSFLVSSAIRTVSSGQIEDLRRNSIEPALHDGDWGGAAVAAANGLGGRSKFGELAWAPMLAVLAIVAIVGATLMLVLRHWRTKWRKGQLAAAWRVDATDPDALAGLPLSTLDDLSQAKVIDVDNALRTSSNELSLAIEEFGEKRTEPFSRAVRAAQAALTQAFTVRQQLDDAIPETHEQRRQMLTSVVVAAAKADGELEAQTEGFEALRDLVIHAPTRLDGLTQRLVELTARIATAEQRLTELHAEFDTSALAPVSDNVATGRARLSFADHNITRARQLADHPVAGQQSELVDAFRAAESALGQARSLFDALDSAAADIRHAVASLPGAITDTEASIGHAKALLDKGVGPRADELRAARDAARRAVDTARRSTNPLAAFTGLCKTGADLDDLLDVLAEERATAERLERALEQALITAQSRVRAASDFIDTRRGSVGSQARTRLAEAARRLAAAEEKRAVDASAALAHANRAAALASEAQSLANADARSAQHAYYGRYGSGDSTGAMLGGIIIGDMLGGMRGGGGWTPTSFGGSAGGGGDFFGGGGRF
jgi:hypothetical protein